MCDSRKTKTALIEELQTLRSRIGELERIEDERKKAEHKLKQYELIVESAHDAIFFKDLKSRYVIANDKTLEAFGLFREQVIGKDDYEIMPNKEEARKNIEDDKLVFETGKSTEVAERMTGSDGKEHWFQAIKVPQFDDKGNIIGLIGIARDITVHRKTHEELQAKTAILQNIISNIPFYVFWKDKNSVYLGCNDNFAKLAGVEKPEDIIGKSDCDLPWKKEESDFYRKIDKEVMTKVTPILNIEESVHQPDGKVATILTSKVPMQNANGEVTGVLGIFTDITERKRVEEALRESQQHKRAILDSIPDIAWLKDKEGRYVAANEPLCKAFGMKLEDLIGRTDFDISPEDLAKRYRADDREVMKSGKRKQIEEQWGKKKGQRIWIETIKSPIYNDKGEIIGTSGIARDITERKKAEEALKESEEKYRDIVEKEKDIIYTLDEKGNITFASPAVEAILGYRPDELIGKHFIVLIAKEWHEKTEADFNNLLKEGEITAETVLLDKQGQAHFVEYASTIIKDGNKVTGTRGIVRDITERKKAEETLREGENKYRTLVENLPQKIFLKDKNSVYVSCNDNLARDFKIKPEEIAGKTDYDLVPKKLAEKYRADDKRIIESGETETIEEKYIQQGEERIIHTVKTPVKDAQGNVIGILGIFWDITEHKWAEQALRESEERYKALFQGAAEGIVVADIETMEFKYVNPATCKMLGYTEEELRQMNVRDIHPQEDLEYVISEFRAQARGEKTLSPNLPCLRKNGTIMYADVDTARVLIDGRECNVGFFTDVTERKEAEEAYRALVDRSLQGLAIFQDGRVVFANQAMAEITGYTVEEMLAMSHEQVEAFVHPQDRALVWSRHWERLKGKQLPERYEFRGIRKDGTMCWLEIHASRIEYQGKTAVQAAYLDITERKNAEKALQKARDELEIRVKQRTADLARVNKELRNEITERKKVEQKLLIYQKQLRSLASELSLSEERLRRRIATNVHDHVGQNLAISKIKIESLRESVTSPELTKDLEEIRDLIAQTIESTRSLTFELSPPVLYELGFEAAVEWLVRQTKQQYGLATEFKGAGLTEPLDNNVRILLFQAVRELLVNVAKHAQAHNVTVSTRRVGNEIRVSVEDDGVGFNISQTGSHDYKSGGFGLFSIRERLGHIGGHFEIESKPGLGTRVTLTAPIDQDDQNSGERRK